MYNIVIYIFKTKVLHSLGYGGGNYVLGLILGWGGRSRLGVARSSLWLLAGVWGCSLEFEGCSLEFGRCSLEFGDARSSLGAARSSLGTQLNRKTSSLGWMFTLLFLIEDFRLLPKINNIGEVVLIFNALPNTYLSRCK